MIAILRQLFAAILSFAIAAPMCAASYVYDPVGNRTQKTSTIPGYPGGLLNYNANDQLTTDTGACPERSRRDANGNTTASVGLGYAYDPSTGSGQAFENHVIRAGAGISLVYDGDGNRVSKTVAGVTTKYLVDTQNPTGYAQVVSEAIAGNTTQPYDYARAYVYGLELVSEYRQFVANNQSGTQTSYYVYDGHGSVRALTNPSGAVTDTYDYDAFGNLIHSTGTTPNNYLFAGEQFDPDLGLYYNRARYLNVSTGRFWTMDILREVAQDPGTLHRYLYVRADPVNGLDPSGRQDDLGELGAEEVADETVDSMDTVQAGPAQDLASEAVQAENDTLFNESLTWQEAQTDTLEEIGGQPQTPFTTPSQGTRIVDVFNPDTGEAVEVKSGYVNFSERVLTQIDKDEELLQAGRNASEEATNVIKKYTWRFYRSPYTGRIGADPRVLAALQDAGIPYQIMSSF